ncbi:MAG: phosphoribosyltransferase family protein [Chloroflexota bacterium]
MATLRQSTLSQFKQDGLVREGHFSFSSGLHSGALLDMEYLTTDPSAVEHMAYRIAKHFFSDHVQTVASPSIQGAGLALWVANFLDPKARVVSAELADDAPYIPEHLSDLVRGKRVLIVDDIIVSGDLCLPLKASVLALGGEVVGIAALWNVGEAQHGGPPVFGLLNTAYEAWPASACPLCASTLAIEPTPY